MPDDSQPEGPTRRDAIKLGGLAVGGALLAGCSADGDSTTGPTGTEPAAATDSSTETATANAAGTATDTPTTTAETPYTVSMEPVGRVEFDEIPETWVPYTADYADMGVALGQADGLAATGVRARFGTHHYEELPGVAVDKSDLTQLWQDGTGKEIFYEVDADVHVIDPNFAINRLGWSQADIDEVRTKQAPFLGNTIFTRVYDWHADYRYYSLYEAFEKMADLFQERERYAAFKAYHDEVVANVQDRLPDETPDVAILYPAEIPPESFYPYLVGEGTQSKQWRDLGVGDALAKHGVTDAQAGGASIDYETLLEIDPDAIAVRLQGEITDQYFRENVVAPMEDHDVASDLTAVQDGRVFYGGLTYQGPIIHLFQLETAARGLFPDEFETDEQLFDRQLVADVVNGHPANGDA